jgi:hypothetical protein
VESVARNRLIIDYPDWWSAAPDLIDRGCNGRAEHGLQPVRVSNGLAFSISVDSGIAQ